MEFICVDIRRGDEIGLQIAELTAECEAIDARVAERQPHCALPQATFTRSG